MIYYKRKEEREDKTMTLWFDMDGTLADTMSEWWTLSDEQWIERVRNAKGMINLSAFAKLIRKAQRNGYKIGICSWLPKSNNEKVIEAKKFWLNNRLPSVQWDFIDIVPNGEPKWLNHNGILFDDNKRNRKEWTEHNGIAYNYNEILETLKTI